ncbi:MAG: TonB-dependent receptor [Pseudomonadota bacterium]
MKPFRLACTWFFMAQAPLIVAQDGMAEQRIESVIVTATRAPIDGSQLPISWSSISGTDVAFTSLQHSNQLFQRSAGTWISRNNGQESLISMRSPVFTGPGSCGSFLTAADGIELRAPGFCNVNQLFDANLAQAGAVEVLRGPATAVYGSNAMHGVINSITASAETSQNAIRVESGSRDFYRLLAGIALPDSGTALNVQASTYGGYQDNSGYDQQKFTLRQDREVGEWSLSGVVAGSNLNQETAGFVQGFEIYEDEDASEENPNPEAYRDASSIRAHLSATRELDNGRSFTITPYLRHNRMEFLQHFFPWQSRERNGHRSIGLQTAYRGDSENVDWVIGADLDATSGWLKEDQAEPFSPNLPQGVHYDYEVDALVVGGFVQGGINLSSRWRLDGGLRVDETRYDYDNQTGDGDACEPAATACRFFRPSDREDNFTNWSGNLGLSYDLGSALVYTRIARGYRAPQTAELYRLQAGQQVADLDSEQMDSFELGVRGELGVGLQYAVNAFWMSKDDVIFQDSDRQNVSGASTDHEGVELELSWRINDVWYAELAGSYADHRYASPIDLRGVQGDIEGNIIDTAPRHFGSARVGANTFIAARPLRAELELIWLDEYYLNPENTASYGGHELLNLRVDWSISQRLKASLVATNLTDERYAERADFAFGNYRYFVGEPLSAVVGIAYALD